MGFRIAVGRVQEASSEAADWPRGLLKRTKNMPQQCLRTKPFRSMRKAAVGLAGAASFRIAVGRVQDASEAADWLRELLKRTQKMPQQCGQVSSRRVREAEA